MHRTLPAIVILARLATAPFAGADEPPPPGPIAASAARAAQAAAPPPPPPPPPPNIPPLEEAREGAATKSVRERLTQHRSNAACAGCHSRIDPLGFALENYDAIGRWRDADAGKPIDNSGEMPDGVKFQGSFPPGSL